jgi:hypothetical protein
MKPIRTHVDLLRPLLTTTYNDAIKLDEKSAIENSPMLSVDKLSDNFSDEKLALKKNFKVVTICEDMMLLPKLYIPSTLNIELILWHTQLIMCAVKC